MTPTEIGKILRAARLRKGLSMGALSRAVGISDVHVGRLERGEISPTLRMLETVTAGLDLQMTILIRKKEGSE